MTMLQLVKALSSRESDELVQKRKDDEKKVKCTDFLWADRYVQTPDNMWMTIWTFIALTVNTFSIFMVYYESAFHLRAFDDMPMIITIFEVILTLEIVIIFFKAYSAKDSHRGWLFSVGKTLGCCKKKDDDEVQANKV